MFPLGLYGLVAASGFLITLASLPAWRHWCRRTGLVDDPGHRKIHHEAVPLAGGLAVLSGVLIPLIAAVGWLWLRGAGVGPVGVLRYGFEKRGLQLAGLLVAGILIVLLGWMDDRYELSPRRKLAGQVLVAVLVAATGTRVTLFVPNVVFSYAVTVLWLVTLMNALNFLDNMNGLCTGLGSLAAFWFGLKAAAAGQFLVAMISFLGTGALLGFLPHNFPRASAFLGDAGSHLVGYLLGVLAILPHFYTAEHRVGTAVLNPLLILAVPLADMVWVVLWRTATGKPFYVGDTNHLSHRLVRAGLSRTQAVLVIWLLAAAIGSLAFL